MRVLKHKLLDIYVNDFQEAPSPGTLLENFTRGEGNPAAYIEVEVTPLEYKAIVENYFLVNHAMVIVLNLGVRWKT